MCKWNIKSARGSKVWQKNINISQATEGFKPNLTGVVNYAFQSLACGIRSQDTILDHNFFPSPTLIRNFWFYRFSVGHTDSNFFIFFIFFFLEFYGFQLCNTGFSTVFNPLQGWGREKKVCANLQRNVWSKDYSIQLEVFCRVQQALSPALVYIQKTATQFPTINCIWKHD